MNPIDLRSLHLTRRTLLGRTAKGVGSLALACLLNPRILQAAQPAMVGRGIIDPLHFAPKAKRVIHLCMAGGPSHLETLDYKPKLAQMSGKPMPESFTKGQPIAQLQNQALKCLEPQHAFVKFGKSGQEICSLFPHIGSIADDICIIRSMTTEAINHDPAHTFMNTGTTISGRPSMGSWLWYGLGSEAQSLPGFVVLTSFAGRSPQPISSRMWHSGFLPGRFQGIRFNSPGAAVEYLDRPAGISRSQQRDIIDAVAKLNRLIPTRSVSEGSEL